MTQFNEKLMQNTISNDTLIQFSSKTITIRKIRLLHKENCIEPVLIYHNGMARHSEQEKSLFYLNTIHLALKTEQSQAFWNNLSFLSCIFLHYF